MVFTEQMKDAYQRGDLLLFIFRGSLSLLKRVADILCSLVGLTLRVYGILGLALFGYAYRFFLLFVVVFSNRSLLLFVEL